MEDTNYQSNEIPALLNSRKGQLKFDFSIVSYFLPFLVLYKKNLYKLWYKFNYKFIKVKILIFIYNNLKLNAKVFLCALLIEKISFINTISCRKAIDCNKKCKNK